jgi:uncharacterized tellurite resistance protein B-like protein
MDYQAKEMIQRVAELLDGNSEKARELISMVYERGYCDGQLAEVEHRTKQLQALAA